jgi:hypothetical protein
MLARLYKARSRRFEGIVERLAGDIDDNVELAENSLADKE